MLYFTSSLCVYRPEAMKSLAYFIMCCLITLFIIGEKKSKHNSVRPSGCVSVI